MDVRSNSPRRIKSAVLVCDFSADEPAGSNYRAKTHGSHAAPVAIDHQQMVTDAIEAVEVTA